MRHYPELATVPVFADVVRIVARSDRGQRNPLKGCNQWVTKSGVVNWAPIRSVLRRYPDWDGRPNWKYRLLAADMRASVDPKPPYRLDGWARGTLRPERLALLLRKKGTPITDGSDRKSVRITPPSPTHTQIKGSIDMTTVVDADTSKQREEMEDYPSDLRKKIRHERAARFLELASKLYEKLERSGWKNQEPKKTR